LVALASGDQAFSLDLGREFFMSVRGDQMGLFEQSGLSRFLKDRRKELRLTLREMEERTGLSKTYLNNLERNIRHNPTPESIEAIAAGYRVPASAVYRLSVGRSEEDPVSSNRALWALFERMANLPSATLTDILPLIDAMVARREEIDGLAKQ
jgi:transcriptional regulator with XRE-family HTH domain